MPVAKVEAALELEVISWRIGVCVTMAVEVGAGIGAAVGAGRAGWTGFASTIQKKKKLSDCNRLYH